MLRRMGIFGDDKQTFSHLSTNANTNDEDEKKQKEPSELDNKFLNTCASYKDDNLEEVQRLLPESWS